MLAAMSGSGFGGRGVEQDVPARAGDQQGDDPAGADIIDVAEDSDRRRGVAPAVLAGAGRAAIRS